LGQVLCFIITLWDVYEAFVKAKMSLMNVAVFMQVTFLFFHGEEEGRVDVASLFQHLALEIRSD
jgi:hypothetical protein